MGFFDGAIKERDQRRARSAVSAADLFKSVARERETAQR
jgi:hypothetical protein